MWLITLPNGGSPMAEYVIDLALRGDPTAIDTLRALLE
jgi:hypothetical protein